VEIISVFICLYMQHRNLLNVMHC